VTPTDHHVQIDFCGTRAGTGAATWSQRETWKNIQWLGDDAHYYNLRGVRPVPPGTTVDSVIEVVRQITERHEVLRTIFTLNATVLTQHVADRGRADVAVHDADDADAGELVTEIVATLTAKLFDYAHEWPVTWAVVTADGQPRHLCFCLSHLAIDAWSLDVLASEIDTMLAGHELAGPVRWQPLDQAAYEKSDEGIRRNTRAVAYWRDTLADAPQSMFDRPALTAATPRFVQYALQSRALLLAVNQLARRCRVTTTAVLLAATATVLGRYTGHERVVMQLNTANRVEPRTREMIAPCVQNGLFTLDISTGTFAEIVRRTLAQIVVCMRSSAYDFLDVELVKEEIAKRRGVAVDLLAFFNDTRSEQHRRRPDEDPPLDAELLGRLRDETQVEHVGAWDTHDLKFFATVRHETGALRLLLLVDTVCVPDDHVATVLRAVEALVVAAVLDDRPIAELGRSIGLPVAAPTVATPAVATPTVAAAPDRDAAPSFAERKSSGNV
jgi:Condensation domain